MHAWFKFACVVLAWTILPAVVLLTGPGRSAPPVQVSTRTSSTSSTSAQPPDAALTSFTAAPAASPATVAHAAPAARPGPARTYAVQRGDSLSAIATRLGVKGGWPALYAANQTVIGSNPNALNVGTVLHLPGPAAVPSRYTVAAGDSLSAIAARFGVHGGWPALYAANKTAIGADPNALPAGVRLTIPSPESPAPSGTAPSGTAPSGTAPSGTAPGGTAPSGTAPGQPQPHSVAPSPAPAHSAPTAAQHSQPRSHAASGMPSWLKTMLLAVGLLAVLVFAAEPLLLARRRRRRRGAAAAPPSHPAGPAPQTTSPQSSVPEMPVMPASAHEGRLAPARIVMADHDRVVVTRSKRDDTICVLRPPGKDPADILRVARLVLPEGHYGKLAEQLGLPANWPLNQ